MKRADRPEEAVVELKATFAMYPEVARRQGWAMLQELQELHGLDDPRTRPPAKAIGRVADLYADDPLPEFYKVVDTLLNWAPENFAFHRAGRWSNGRTEGANNTLGALGRMAYGFVNADNFAPRGPLLCRGTGP